MMKRHVHDRTQAGFSLIELMVVVAIIGILTSLAPPILSKFRDRAKIAAAKGAGTQILNALTAAALTDPEGAYPVLGTCNNLARVVNGNGYFFSPEMSTGLCPQDEELAGELCACYVEETDTWIYYNWEPGAPPQCPEGSPTAGITMINPAYVFRLHDVQEELYLVASTISGVDVVKTPPVAGDPVS